MTWREWTAEDSAEWIAAPSPDDDKYTRGVLGVITGSADYPGAAVLGSKLSWPAGVGMVRYSGPRPVRTAVLAQRPETVTVAGRVQGWLVGSGIDLHHRSFLLQGDLQRALTSRVPVVLDAAGSISSARTRHPP